MYTAKYFYLALLLFAFFFASCELNNNEANNTQITLKKIENVSLENVPDSIRQLYKNYASVLALRQIHSDPKLKETLINIPSEYIVLFYDALIQVYNATGISARNAVIDEYSISVFPYPETTSLLLKVDTSYSWVKNLANGSTLSGEPGIDSLFINYNLTVNNYYNWTWANYFEIKAMNQLNILALCNRFSKVNGVLFAEPNGIMGDGNDISAIVSTDFVQLQYSYGFGDCPSGCISRHYWIFRVYYTGVVEYLYEGGDPI